MDPRPSMMAIQAMIVLMLAVYQLLLLLCLVCADCLLTTPKQESGEDEPSENPMHDLFSQERGNIIDEVVYRLTMASRRWRLLREVLIFFFDGPKTTSHWDYNMKNFGNCFNLVKEFVMAVNDWMNVRPELTGRSAISNSSATCSGKTTYENSDSLPHQSEDMQLTISKTDKEVQPEAASMPMTTEEQGVQYSEHNHLKLVAAGSHCMEETLEMEDDIDIRVRGATTATCNDQPSQCKIHKITHPKVNPEISQARESSISHQASGASRTGTSPPPPQDVRRKWELCPDDDNETQIHAEAHPQAHPPVICQPTDKPMSAGLSPGKEPSVQQVQNDHTSSSTCPTHHHFAVNELAGTASNVTTSSENVVQDTSSTSKNHNHTLPVNHNARKRSISLPSYMSKQEREKSLTKRSKSLNSITDKNHFTGSVWVPSLVTMALMSDKDIRKPTVAMQSGLNAGIFPSSSYKRGKPIALTDKVVEISSEDTISQNACASAFHPMTDLQGQPTNSSEEMLLKKSDRTRLQHPEEEPGARCFSKVTHDTELETSLDSPPWPGQKRRSMTPPLEETMFHEQAEKQSDKNTTGHFGNDKPRQSQEPDLERQNNPEENGLEPSAPNGQGLLDHKYGNEGQE